MAERRNFELIGANELVKAMKKLPKEVVGKKGGPLKSAMMSAMLPVLRDAQAAAPVSDEGRTITLPNGSKFFVFPGRLKRAIRRRRHPNPRGYDEIVGVGVFAGTKRNDPFGAFYAHFVEMGTVKQPPQPFLRPAFEKNSNRAVTVFGKKAADRVKTVARQIGSENAREVAAAVKTIRARRSVV